MISFHSLEDRIVKNFIRKESRDCLCPPEQLVCTCGHKAVLRELTRHPVIADEDEIRINPRARSARLRAEVKLKKTWVYLKKVQCLFGLQIVGN